MAVTIAAKKTKKQGKDICKNIRFLFINKIVNNYKSCNYPYALV